MPGPRTRTSGSGATWGPSSLGNSGYVGGGRRVDMWRSGIYAEVYGRQGVVAWREVIERVRAAVVQPSLF